MENNNPIAVFDSGVGSFSIVRVLRKVLPSEHIIYLADRVSFPYGTKTNEELKDNIISRIKWLEKTYNPKIIVVASNTPSIQVLDKVIDFTKTKLFGVYPPIEKAVSLTKTNHIGILATKGAVESPEIDNFIKSKNIPEQIKIAKINASDLVALVEPGTFQTDKEKTSQVIKNVIDAALKIDSEIDVMTLSSTHLPFLKSYFEELYPEISFIDPADNIAKEVLVYLENEHLMSGCKGILSVITTVDEEKNLTADGLKDILMKIGLNTEIKPVLIN